jgi:SET domain-containing protein
MLAVKTELRKSEIHGFGVFAAEFIPKCKVVWYFKEGFDHRVSEDFVDALPEPARSTLRHYSACWGGGYVISADDARFLNHSTKTPNLKSFDYPDCSQAVHDIQIGEELLEDYSEFDKYFEARGMSKRPEVL